MEDAVIVDCVRTPIGRAHKNIGVFRNLRADDLAVATVKALLQRTGMAGELVEDVVFGASGQRDEQGFNLARMIALLSGLPITTPGVSINRLCGSSLQAVAYAALSIRGGMENVQVVGGTECMLRVPMETTEFVNPRLFEVTPVSSFTMGLTAEYLAKARKVSREKQDAYALHSHQKAARAQAAGEFANEIVPVWGHDRKDQPQLIDFDQCVRPDTSMEQLAALQPSFDPVGTVTAGNSSPLNDGAAGLLMMSMSRAKELGLRPLARYVSSAAAAVEPNLMGTGPIPASLKALQRAGLTLDDMDLIELNEAFAVQSIVCQEELRIPEEKLNVRGGSIALGHPIGASGARVVTSLIHNMLAREARFGLASICIGMGQGFSAIFERVE